MAIHLISTRFCLSKVLLPMRYVLSRTNAKGGLIKQVVYKWHKQAKFIPEYGLGRQYHCSKHGPTRIHVHDRQWVFNNRLLKWSREYPKPQCAVRFMCVRMTHWRMYCTRGGGVSLPKSGNKAVTPKVSEISRLLALAVPEKTPLFFGICLLFISSAVTISVPFALGKVIDIIYNSSHNGSTTMLDDLTKLCGVLAVVFVCGAVANLGRIYLMNVSGQRIIKRLRESVFQSIIRQEIGFFDKTRTGELINRLSADSSLIGQSVTQNVSDGLRSMVQAIGGISMMFYSSVKLASVVLSIVPPVAVLAIVYGRYVRNISKQVQDSLASATEIAEEKISHIRTVRAFSQEGREIEAYSRKVDNVLELSKKEAMLLGIFYGSMGLSGNLIILSVLYNGGMMMSDAQITVGDLSAFMMYAAYVGISIGGLSTFYTGVMKGIGASTRLWELLDKQPTIPIEGGSVPVLSTLQGQLEFKNLNFSYPMRHDIPILKDLNLVFPAGKVTAVVGSSGSGKSTLGLLVLRYYDPDEGHILLDGSDIKSLNPKWLRHQIGTVSQDPTLFSCSIAENIAYGAENPDQVTTAEIIEAAKTANAYDFVQGFTNKFDTMVGERGLMLSGGQRQRIALARAVLANPRILLLDEATSALDAESEYFVQEALERLMVGRTVITIAHRLSTIKRAHAIAVLQNGAIAELGPYEQLINYQDGVFKKLVERQTVMNN